MSRKLYWLYISLFILYTHFFFANDQVQASPVLNVGLTRFEAIPLDNAARLEWDTETELSTAGFMLKRGQDGSFHYISDPNGTRNLFINSEGGPIQGFEYSFTDTTAVNGETYTYQLIEVQVDASEVVIADAPVAIGIEATDTPIIVGALGGDGGNSNSNDATATATSAAKATLSPIVPTDSAPVPSATAIPSLAAEIAAPSVPVVDEIAPLNSAETQPISSQPLVEENRESGQSRDGGAAIALAQEEPPGYPAAEPVEEDSGEPADAAQIDANRELDVPDQTGDNGDPPKAIGTNPYPAGNTPAASEQSAQSGESAAPTSSLEGKIYLWVAFIAAIVIFTAAALGTILIYTRQRSQE